MKDSDLRPALEKLFLDYAVDVGCHKQSAIRDMLTDLRHLSAKYGINFQDALDGSATVYLEEVGDSNGG
jgi:hypothetical protein